MIRTLVTLSISLFFLTALPAQDALSWLYGHWKGTGYQVPTNSTWDIDMTYDPVTGVISIKYPSLKCGGNWQFVKTIGKGAEFTEWIEEGKENCDDAVKIVVTYIDEEYVSVAYFLPDLYDGVVAHSVLRKQDKI